MTVPGVAVVFRGSHALEAGLVTRGRLRGPRYRRLFPDVYCRATATPDLLLRSLAAYRLANRHRFHPPMETRLRLLIISAGLPPPHVQWIVQDPVAELIRARSRST